MCIAMPNQNWLFSRSDSNVCEEDGSTYKADHGLRRILMTSFMIDLDDVNDDQVAGFSLCELGTRPRFRADMTVKQRDARDCKLNLDPINHVDIKSQEQVFEIVVQIGYGDHSGSLRSVEITLNHEKQKQKSVRLVRGTSQLWEDGTISSSVLPKISIATK